jgi:hypothetical protein
MNGAEPATASRPWIGDSIVMMGEPPDPARARPHRGTNASTIALGTMAHNLLTRFRIDCRKDASRLRVARQNSSKEGIVT